MIHRFEEAVEQVLTETRAMCVIVFGSVARDEVLPGADLDLIAVTRELRDWTYAPASVGGIPVDLNVVSVDGLEARLEYSWYWRAVLRRSKLRGRSRRVEEALRRNRELGNLASERALVAKGWLDVADAHFAAAAMRKTAWLRHAAEWCGFVSLANGVIELSGGTPHAYHNHFSEVARSLLPHDLRERYRSQVHSSYVACSEVPAWLWDMVHALGPAVLQRKAAATATRALFLCDMGRDADSAIYVRHAAWVLLVYVACSLTGTAIPASQSEYSACVERIAEDVPKELQGYFLRRRGTSDVDLRGQLARVLVTEGNP